jgi:hypothetical protein
MGNNSEPTEVTRRSVMKGSDTRNKDVFLIKTCEDPSCLLINKPNAASLELTEEASAPKQQIPCLAPSLTTRKARAEMLKPTNGRESQAPAATLQWGPHGITPVAQPQGECWVSIQHIPKWKGVRNFMPPAGSFALLSGGLARVLRGSLCGMCPGYVWRAQNTWEHFDVARTLPSA